MQNTLQQQQKDVLLTQTEEISGSEAVLKAFIEEGVDTIFGYPGGAIMPIYDALFDFDNKLKHILVRHEQGSIHAAQPRSAALRQRIGLVRGRRCSTHSNGFYPRRPALRECRAPRQPV